MRALVMHDPKDARLKSVREPSRAPGEALLRVRRAGLCGTDLNSYRGRNTLVSYTRIPGHEIATTIVEMDENRPNEGHPRLAEGMDVTLSPYTSCGQCSAS